jgi:DNA-directed RNA polymerase subunit F
LSYPLKLKVDKLRLISNPEALQILKELSEKERERFGEVSFIVQRVLEYLHKFNKVPIERAREFREKLESMGLKEDSIVMIMNICPRTIDELLILLVNEERSLEKERLEEILKLVNEYCIGE